MVPVQDQGAIRVERFEITPAHDERLPGLLLTPATAPGLLPLVLIGHPPPSTRAATTSSPRPTIGPYTAASQRTTSRQPL